MIDDIHSCIRLSADDTGLYIIVDNLTRLAFIKAKRPSHGVLQLLKHFYSVLILHLLKPIFSVFHVFQALSSFLF